MEILSLAQDTSNVDDTGMSSGEVRERNKKRRRTKAKRKLTSSSSSEEEELIGNKENYPVQNKKVLPFPQMEKFVCSSTSLTEKSAQHIENIINDDICTSAVSNNTNIYKYYFVNHENI